MKKFAYTLVTSPLHDRDDDAAPGAQVLMLRERLVIADGPSYYREYNVAVDELTSGTEALGAG